MYHRSYEIREPIEIRIDPQELVVLSFPGPDRSIRLVDLQAGKAVSRRYRNRRIGEFLKELDLTEGRSTGVPKILRVMNANASPTPVFETDEDRTSFLIRLPIHEGFTDVATTTPQVTPQVTPEVTRLIDSLKGEMSRAELMAMLGLKDTEHFRKVYLAVAIDEGVIERTIPDKPNSRLQKYRLTELRKKMLSMKNIK